MKRIVCFMAGCLFVIGHLVAAEWQWSVSVDKMISPETGKHPQAFLWVPPMCERVKAVMFGQHNMSEETLFEKTRFRDSLAVLDIALVWITPGLDQRWEVESGVQEVFDNMMNDLAEVSGYSELADAPVIPVGHSALATFPWNFAAWNPERTLAVISLHGDAPRTNLTGYGRANLEWGRTRNINGIPGLMIEGEYEWWEARVNPALAFRMMYPESCISFLCDTGRGHFDVADETADYIALFLKKALQYRCVEGTGRLKQVDMQKGWLAERWNPDEGKRPQAAPYACYKGDPHDAFWYFDREMAETTEKRYALHRRKEKRYIGFVQEGKLLKFDPQLHAGIVALFLPEEDGLTFHLKAMFTDSLRSVCVGGEEEQNICIDRICGPVEKLNDTTFAVRFYRMGMDNSRRTNDIWLVASHPGDKKHKGCVQQMTMRIPYRQTEGKRQYIWFPGIDDVSRDIRSIRLAASSDCGLPVYYYVKEGPAEVSGNELRFTPIPPRSRFPIKVTVVAWQYGIAGKVQTAEPVERSFYICQ